MTYGMTNDVKIGAPGGLANFDIGQFQTVLVNELIPYVDANFRTLADARHRAMAGLSMGGMETKLIPSSNLDKFSYIGLFSGGTNSLDDVNRSRASRKRPSWCSSALAAGSSKIRAGDAPPGMPPSDPRANAEL